ncbi:sterigmatocystin biosynthesis regulatory [Fusarium sp. NRRL 25303]|nr:sterigmatocystin biosynthesis regulatory [Fusarium sp. NRRL 25303]
MVPPKLRGCCDSCTKSKLKCSGEMPCCQRCRIRGLDCVYSKARRAGRPRLKPKPSQASITSCINREPQTNLITFIGQPANDQPCPEPKLPVCQNPDILPYSPDTQDIAYLMQDAWTSTPCPSSDVTQPSNVCDFDDLILQDMMLNINESFDLVSPRGLKQEWGQDNALFSDGLEDTCPGYGITNEGPPSHTPSSLSEFYKNTIRVIEDPNGHISEVDMEINAIIATITDIAKRPIASYHLDDQPCASSWPQLVSNAQLLMYIAGSVNSSSPRLDAVLQISWAAEQVQKRISGCSACKPRIMEVSSMLALLYDWISSHIADALESPAALQSCRLRIGSREQFM